MFELFAAVPSFHFPLYLSLCLFLDFNIDLVSIGLE